MKARYAISVLIVFECSSLMGQLSHSQQMVSLLAFGDVNLGRMVGQELIRGDTGYPFRFVSGRLAAGDVVFVNLESQLSDQNGETQHPHQNLVFTGPPAGAASLKLANISVVSTANNHAFDYGMKALRETMVRLHGVGVESAGTSFDSVAGSVPAIVEKNGIRIGLLAYSEFVNIGGAWRGRIALFDTSQCRQDIEALRRKVDLVVVSYHAGAEYTDRPSQKLLHEFRFLVDAGADVVLGHHPHYVQGLETYRGKPIFYSLGNFVFYQPQRELATFGLGADLRYVRTGGTVKAKDVRLIPLRAGLQPTFELTRSEVSTFFRRLMKLSPSAIKQADGEWFMNLRQTYD